MIRFIDHLSSRRIATIGLVVIFLLGLVTVFVWSNGEKKSDAPPVESSTTLIRRCPDAWYADKMPTISNDGKPAAAREYLVIDGKRVELSQADMAWIGANCSVEKKTVY